MYSKDIRLIVEMVTRYVTGADYSEAADTLGRRVSDRDWEFIADLFPYVDEVMVNTRTATVAQSANVAARRRGLPPPIGALMSDQEREAMIEKYLTSLTQHVDFVVGECDGITRLVHLALARSGIAHKVYSGWVHVPAGDDIAVHFWAEVEGWIIDYRLRMWAGEQAPHGVFRKDKFLEYEYVGLPIEWNLRDCELYERIAEVAFDLR